MSRWIFGSFFLISASFAFGQLDSNSVTVAASRSTSLQPDQALFAVFVNTDLNAGLSDVVAAVQSAGLTIANLSGVGTITVYGNNNEPQSQTQWAFRLTVPVGNIKQTTTALTALQKSVMQANANWATSFSLQGLQVSQQLQQSQTCDFAGVISDARVQAQNLAAASGRTLSGILALSTSTSTTVGSSTSLYPGYSPLYCSATVKFALLGSN
jgi:hypothetical protein